MRHKKIIELMVYKQAYIDWLIKNMRPAHDRIDYFRESDYRILDTIPEEDQHSFVARLAGWANKSLFVRQACIFCFTFNPECTYCPYAEAKGECQSQSSDDVYSETMQLVKDCGVELPTIEAFLEAKDGIFSAEDLST